MVTNSTGIAGVILFGGDKAGFKSTTTWPGMSLPSNLNWQGCYVNDMYGTSRDGVICGAPGATNMTWSYFASTGTGWAQTTFTTPWTVQITGGSSNNLVPIVPASLAQLCVFANLNGDGIKDIACSPGPNPGYGAVQGSPNWFVALSSRPN